MRMLTKLPLASVLCVSTAAWTAPPVPKYALIEIPSIVAAGGTMSAAAINDRDEVVGNATEPDGPPFFGEGPLAFFYQSRSGAVNQLTFSSQQASYAGGLNDRGQIAGYADVLPTGLQAVLWSSIGGAEALGPSFPQSIGMAVSKSGTVVGNFNCAAAQGCASLWSGRNHVFAALPLLPTAVIGCTTGSSNALAINSKGRIVGWAESCGGGAVEWRDGQIKLLVADVVNQPDSVATAINDDDEVVGTAGGYAFRYRHGSLSNLGTLPGDASSSAYALNNRGEIVGASQDANGNSRAFLYVHGQMYDLNSLSDPGSVTLQTAVGINPHGWIAASGTSNGQQNAYLLERVR
jgi:probable HAF family extracellular repeat protein